MKIYTKIVIEMDTMQVIEEDSFLYAGPVSLAKGGSSSTTTVDKEYNSRMAKIAEKQQKMAEEYFSYWKETEQPLEKAQAESALSLLPSQTALTQEQLSSQLKLLPTQTNVAQSYYDKVLQGVNVGEETEKAVADVQQATSGIEGERRREFARMGLDMSSPAYASLRSADLRKKAAQLAGAKTQARRYSDDEQMRRLQGAVGTL